MRARLHEYVRSVATIAATVAVMFLALPASAAPATTSAPNICLPVHLTATGQDLGSDGDGHLITTSTVFLAGHPVATTRATFTPAGPPSGNTLAFTGPIAFSLGSQPSVLTANVQGSVDLSTGVFQATSTSVSGSGLLTGLYGSLVFQGVENLATGAFSETIRGLLCSKIRPW